MDRHGQTGATTFEYAIMLGLVLFALAMVAVSVTRDQTAAGGGELTCSVAEAGCDLAAE